MRRNKSAEAIALACEFNLICKGASFIAVDEAEKGPVAVMSLVQPAQQVRNVKLLAQVACAAASCEVVDTGDYDSSGICFSMPLPRADLSNLTVRRFQPPAPWEKFDHGVAVALHSRGLFCARVAALPLKATQNLTVRSYTREELVELLALLEAASSWSRPESLKTLVIWALHYEETFERRVAALHTLIGRFRQTPSTEHENVIRDWLIATCEDQEDLLALGTAFEEA